MDKSIKITSLFAIILIAFSIFYYLVLYLPHKEERAIAIQNAERMRLEEEKRQQELNDPKSNKYIVTYDKDGNPLTWEKLTTIAAVLENTLKTYEDALKELSATQDEERDLVAKIYSALKDSSGQTRIEFQNMIKYSESYIASGDKLIDLLVDLIKNYQGYLASVENRDAVIYLNFSEEVNRLEAQKTSILADYQAKGEAKRNYAKGLMAN